jgi:hypothetical protein
MRWLLLALGLLLAHPAAAATCAAGQTDDTLSPLPAALVPQAVAAFGLHGMPAAQVEKSTVIRCLDGKILACNYGANLPCGKANTSRAMPAATAWCHDNPAADFIPAYITGHDSIFNWHCVGGAPAATGPPAALDARGFLAAYWRPII